VTVVGSSGWTEFFSDGPLADRFALFLADPAAVVAPTVVILEICRVIRRERSEEDATAAVARMQRTSVADLDQFLALTAADLGLRHRLSMADPIGYATAVCHGAGGVTTDTDFEALRGATVFRRT